MKKCRRRRFIVRTADLSARGGCQRRPQADQSAVRTVNRRLRGMGEAAKMAAPFMLIVADQSAVRTVNRRLRVALAVVVMVVLILSGCSSSTAAQPDARLKVFHVLSARIIMQDNQAEVDGTIQNTGHDPFPYDVTISATFYDNAGNVIGQAQGVAEDVFPGTIGAFVLVGQVDSVRYSHMQLTLVSLRERRVEHFTPTPPVSP